MNPLLKLSTKTWRKNMISFPVMLQLHSRAKEDAPLFEISTLTCAADGALKQSTVLRRQKVVRYITL